MRACQVTITYDSIPNAPVSQLSEPAHIHLLRSSNPPWFQIPHSDTHSPTNEAACLRRLLVTYGFVLEGEGPHRTAPAGCTMCKKNACVQRTDVSGAWT